MTKNRRKQLRSRLAAPIANALSLLAKHGKTVFSAADFAGAMGRREERIYRILSKLTSGGWITRLTKGEYLIVPFEAGPESAWTENAMVIAGHLATPAAVAYWTACHYWNWTEQASRTVFVQTTQKKFSNTRDVSGVTYRFVTIRARKFFGIKERTAGQTRFSITDREKTLVDALDRPDLCGGIRQVREMLPEVEVNWKKVEDDIARVASGAITKRLGWLVESLGEKVKLPNRQRRLEQWRSRLTGGYAPLEPGGPPTGPVDNRWLVRINNPGMLRYAERS